MKKKIFAAAAVAGALVFSGAAAANAADYPADVTCTASPAVIEVGGSSTISCAGLATGEVEFVVEGPGVTDSSLSSLVFASTPGIAAVSKTADASGNASATFTAPAVGSFSVAVADMEENGAFITVTVNAAGTGTGGGSLPATGSDVPLAAIWLGVGAVGIGGIAVTAAVARRRSAAQR